MAAPVKKPAASWKAVMRPELALLGHMYGGIEGMGPKARSQHGAGHSVPAT